MRESVVYNPAQDTDWKDIFFGLFVACLLVVIFYPGFVLLRNTPMHSVGWELMDPIVSTINFEPSFNEFQRSLYTDHNILWSSLRNMGMPILAVDIQAAPLFPLTLLLSGLDSQLFWIVFTVLQLVLMGLGVYLLVRRFFLFARLPSIFFVIAFIYSLYVLRWMNHPWMNGFLAGIYYLFFLCQTCVQGREHTIRRLCVFAGLTISVYSMVTCGFPEAALMSAFFVVFTYTPFVVSRIVSKKIVWRSYLSDLFLGHFAGFALASYQIFSVLEILHESGVSRERGLRQYLASDMAPFFLECVTQFSTAAPVLFKDSRTFFGVLPLFFFFLGIGATIRHYKKISYGEIGAFLCGIFILFKLFDIGPAWFNVVVASLPLAKETYFYVYFFTLFLWAFSYFSAKGFHCFLDYSTRKYNNSHFKWRIVLVIVQLLVIVLVLFAAISVSREPLKDVLLQSSDFSLLKVLLLFGLSIICVHFYLSRSKNKEGLTIPILGGICLLFVVAEIKMTLPDEFARLYRGKDYQLQYVINYLETNNIPLLESRISDPFGSYVSAGLATIDTGDAPLLSNRLLNFRRVFFTVNAGGNQPIKHPRNVKSWRMTSTNLKTMDRYYGDSDPTFPQWGSMQKFDGGDIHIDQVRYNKIDLKKEDQILLKGDYPDLFYFRGWGVGNIQENVFATSTFVILKNESEEFDIPTIKAVRPDVARHLGHNRFVKAGFKNYMSASFLKTGSYNIIIRLVNESGAGYYEYDTGIEIHFEKVSASRRHIYYHAFHNDGSAMDFVGILGNKYIYYDKKALPRAYVATSCKNFESVNKIIGEFKRNIKNFTLGEVYVDTLADKEKQFCRDYSSDLFRVPIVFDHGDELQLGKIRGPATVVLNDNIYPGWQATDLLSDEKIAIKPGNITFKVLFLPEDREYQILFEYKPKWLIFANILVFFGLFILFSTIVLTVKRRVL